MHGFNRLSRALWAVGVRVLKLSWLNYYDDFPILESSLTVTSARHSAECLMATLGCQVSKSDSKQLEFSPSFGLLGVELDFGSRPGAVIVQNRPSRVEQLRVQVAELITQGTLTPKQAASVRGRFQFAESQAFGKAAVASLRLLGT